VRVRQILINLLSNAIKFTERGSVTLKASCTPTAVPDLEELLFAISDTGIGLEADKLNAIFEKFVQADSSISHKYGGTGLGLAISKSLTDLMGGTISATSVLGKGSSFDVHLKMPRGAPVAATSGERQELSVPAPPIATLLLVEDYSPNVLVATHMVKSFGYACDVAMNGMEALQRLKDGGIYAAILLDVQMPGLSGFETTRMIRAFEAEAGKPRTPIIGVTAYALTGDRERCLAAGMDDYITKPIEMRLLKAALDQWVGSQKKEALAH
jgi:CheY-like chemotaxis protein